MDKHRYQCDINRLIKDAGLKWTTARHTIITHFTEPRTWSASQLLKEIEWIDTSTIYRNLKKLAKHKIITPLLQHNGEVHYEWSDRDHHDHLVCDDCDIIECTPCPAPKLGSHKLELQGLCSACQ